MLTVKQGAKLAADHMDHPRVSPHAVRHGDEVAYYPRVEDPYQQVPVIVHLNVGLCRPLASTADIGWWNDGTGTPITV